MNYEAIVIGVSSGGMNALKFIFSTLPASFSIPIIIVQHVSPRSDNEWIELLNENSNLTIKEADEKEKIACPTEQSFGREPGNVYIAPSNYHLLIEKDKTFSLTIDERVNYARPSIDVLFESAAEAYKNKLIGIVLTGSNNDGAKGIKRIKECGGLAIIQDPKTAESSYMPASAIAACLSGRQAIQPDYILSLEKIIELIKKMDKENKSNENNNQE